MLAKITMPDVTASRRLTATGTEQGWRRENVSEASTTVTFGPESLRVLSVRSVVCTMHVMRNVVITSKDLQCSVEEGEFVRVNRDAVRFVKDNVVLCLFQYTYGRIRHRWLYDDRDTRGDWAS